MGDIFKREAAANPEPFTGERLTAALDGQTQIEHYHRYLFARSFCHGLDVLDVASGEGYGAAQIAQVARRVTGVDYAQAAVDGASASFPRDNLRFMQGDARSLPLGDASFDIAVSFETIEHFDHQEKFLAEIARVLKPGGLVIISTPDRDIYSPAHTGANEYHVRELSRTEFATLLSRHFTEVSVLVQRPIHGCAIMGEAGTAVPPLVFDRRGAAHFEACAGIPRAPFLIALASNRPLPPIPDSLYVERDDLDRDLIALEDMRALFNKARIEIANAQAKLTELHLTVARTTEESLRIQANNQSLGQELALARGSLRSFLGTYLPQLRRRLFG